MTDSGKSVVEELSGFVQSSKCLPEFIRQDYAEFAADVRRFLQSTMDEVRLWHASKVATHVLKQVDFIDADHFREGVLRREASGTIAYDGQRDHSAHTVYNWLLGWYFFEKCEPVRVSFAKHASARGYGDPKDLAKFFGELWLHVSLLHDIGYVFEGSLGPLDAAAQNRQSQLGAQLLQDYFQSRLWTDIGFSSVHKRARLLDLSGVGLPLIAEHSTIGVTSTQLRELGDLKMLTAAVREMMPESEGIPRPAEGAPLPSDAFDLWARHYELFGQKAAKDRILKVRACFEKLLYGGLPDIGLRVMDHGVCSGLVLLLVATFYYRVFAGANAAFATEDGKHESSLKEFIQRKVPHESYDPTFWWTGILWATAATAVHNIVQQRGMAECPDPVGLDEDPLAFLGILVDSVQEWDRYYVFKRPGRFPIQGVDCGLRCDKRVVLTIRNKKRVEKLLNELNQTLEGWDTVLEVATT